ncbi:hypothetical protein QC764_0052880 [Podospora pseudoanserina]|uniref:Uncharacterized protein n=1 Tax=Podospora pseudoanserina TaxID=2609844 RepID=A0ABR0ICS7_9PEZI|nr:hypothetical protein QC764_0052880 [Podospora pseudoanserina]
MQCFFSDPAIPSSLGNSTIPFHQDNIIMEAVTNFYLCGPPSVNPEESSVTGKDICHLDYYPSPVALQPFVNLQLAFKLLQKYHPHLPSPASPRIAWKPRPSSNIVTLEQEKNIEMRDWQALN